MKEFISEEKIKETITLLAKTINEDYDTVHLVGLLKGGAVFLSDLMRQLTIPVTIDFMSVVSYENSESIGEIKILKELNDSIFDKDVLIVEDILDTGLTLRSIIDLLLLKHPKSLNVVTLLDKPSRRTVPVEAKYVGIEIEDVFCVGMGMDYNQQYRNLPYIGTIPITNEIKVKKRNIET